MRVSAIFLSLLAIFWLALCLYLVLPQLIGLNFTGHIVLGELVASLPATTALLGFVLIFLMLARRLGAIEQKLDMLVANSSSENHQQISGNQTDGAPKTE